VERPSLNDKLLIVERRSLHSARSLPRAKSRGAPVETTKIVICDSPARKTGEAAADMLNYHLIYT
jgi:hypothetical protein